MQRETRVKDYIMPTRVLWETPGVLNSGALLEEKPFQTSFTGPSFCTVPYKGAILLDFGREMQGGVQILVQNCGKEAKSRIRVRFGESAMEAMSQIGEKNSTNHHAPRDEEFDFSFFSNIEFGNTGFRFVRIDVTEDSWVQIRQVRAMYVHSGRPLEGSFSCSDPLLNKIWETGAYTVYQNMQDYLWDGIKRDRLVWIGDMHPETSTISAIYGYDDCVHKSLNLVRDETPADSWMNGLPTYSMWWIKIHHDWYMHNGDFAFLKEQESYLEKLVEHLISCVNDDGTNTITDKFIDWPSSTDPVAQEAGVHSMLVASLTAAKNIFSWCGNEAYAKKCADTVSTLKNMFPAIMKTSRRLR